jgi:DNA-binding NarL/FixJ family response regulator
MRVLVADDHALFRDGIVSLLQAAGHAVVGQVGNGLAAVESARRLRPDVILMDIKMPDMTGIEALRHVRAELPEIRVVILTASDTDADLIEAVRAGASGYLLKNLNSDAFLEMLSGLERGEAAMTRQTTARVLAGFASSGEQDDEIPVELSDREVELLRLIAEGFSNKAIARQLSLSENTIKYHIKNILQKLGVQNRTEAISRAIQKGIIGQRPAQ